MEIKCQLDATEVFILDLPSPLVRPALVRTSVGVLSTLLPLTPHTVHPAFEDGTDTGFRNVGQLQFDAGEMPRRKYTIFKSRRKSEIKIQ